MNYRNTSSTWKILSTVSTLALGASSCAAQEVTPPETVSLPAISVKPNLPSKKLIQYGWDQVYATGPAYIRDNIREMEKRPFDGIAFALPEMSGTMNGGRVFDVGGWKEEKARPILKVLEEIKWDKFTDNFISLQVHSTMDWFSDSDWDTVLAHTKFMAQAVKVGRCKGILLDAEPYAGNPWRYDQQKNAGTKSFEEYSQMTRQRGKQFMQALTGEMPDIKLLMLFGYSLFYEYVSQDPDPIKRAQVVSKNEYALMAPFIDGMLEAAASQVEFIDGNEFSYYYENPLEFYSSYHDMLQSAKQYAAPELRGKFSRHVKAGQSVYIDYLFNLRPGGHKASPAQAMTPEQSLRWFEHNTYYALKTSDEYVWMYGENVSWWDQKVPHITEQTPKFMQSLSQTILSAKGKVERGEELGFDVTIGAKTQ